MSFFGGISTSLRKAGKQTSQNLANGILTPVTASAHVITGGVKAVLPAVASVVGGLKKNPELLSLAGGLTGLPVGDFFGGGAGGAVAPAGYAPPPAPAESNKTLLYVGIAGAALLVIVLLMRK